MTLMDTAVAFKTDNIPVTQDWLESIPAGVIFINAEGIIDCYNRQAEELLDLSKHNRIWSTVLQANVKQIVNDGHYIILLSGKCIVFKTQSLPNEKGQLVLLVDETDIYQSHHRAMKLQNLDSIEKLSATLAHQLRTPLSTAILYAGAMNDEPSREKMMKPLLLIKQQIDDVLMVCKGQEKLIECFNIQDEIAKLIEDYRQLYNGIPIELKIAQNLNNANVLGHKASLLGAIMNIIDNAIQANSIEVPIVITLSKQANFICIEIKDFGKGIKQENIERVKKAFYTTKQNGTGLGLAIAQSILQAHQGKLEIESVASQFTAVKLYIPEHV